jgi:hypothetical protein
MASSIKATELLSTNECEREVAMCGVTERKGFGNNIMSTINPTGDRAGSQARST